MKRKPKSRVLGWALALVAIVVPGGILIALLLHWMSDRGGKERTNEKANVAGDQVRPSAESTKL